MAEVQATTTPVPSFEEREARSYLAMLLIIVAGAFVYMNGMHGPFVLDDLPGISENPTTQDLWASLKPPAQGQTVTGRPLVNFTLALNYAWNVHSGHEGYRVEVYHEFNLILHLAAGLTLFGLVKRTLELPRLRERFAGASLPVAFLSALVWTVHPLESEAVSYVIQRAEAMMALFYLLTLYCFVRSAAEDADPLARAGWQVVSVATCLLGMTCKEVMVSAPLMVLLYDRTFFSGNFLEAFKKRRGYYALLACTWILQIFLAISAGTRGRSAGWGAGVGIWEYARWQFGAMLYYLWLAVWPHPLILDYGRELGDDPGPVVIYALAVALLAAATLWALWKRPMLGFFGAWYFMILAPSSSVVPIITQRWAEHRMYLPMAGLVVLAVASVQAVGGRNMVRFFWPVALALGWLTFLRNAEYSTAVQIWSDVARKQPGNPRAFANLGIALAAQHRLPEALSSYETALAMKPAYPDAQTNYANALGEAGRPDEAIEHYRMGLKYASLPAMHYNLGNALAGLGRLLEARDEFAEAVKAGPNFAPAYNNLGNVLSQLGDTKNAIIAYENALRINPNFSQAECNLGIALDLSDKTEEALPHLLRSVRLDPGFTNAYYWTANTLVLLNRLEEGADYYRKALEMAPNAADLRNNYGTCLLRLRRIAEAEAQFREALRLAPDSENAKKNLEDIQAIKNGGNK